MKVDPSKFTCTQRKNPSDDTQEFWLFYNGSHVASGMANSFVGIINAQNIDYHLAALAFLTKNYPEYNWV